MSDLKPCPFCGSDRIANYDETNGAPYGPVVTKRCDDCGSMARPEAWNTRHCERCELEDQDLLGQFGEAKDG